MVATPQENLVAWLRDAHAMEEQAETMLSAQHQRIENYPELKARIGQHLEETRAQAEALRGCLERIGAANSTIKDSAAKLTAFAQGLGGAMTSDEVVKGSIASYTFEHMEIASYRVLVATAELAGDGETASVCRRILDEEIAMANWLEQQLPDITRAFLARDTADVTAKR